MSILRIQLASGRDIFSSSILVRSTYWGVLEGVPTVETNRWVTDEIQQTIAKLFPYSQSLLANSTSMEEGKGSHVADLLPPITVIAHFLSHSAARSLEYDQSSLVVVWFQNTLEPIVSIDIESRLVAIEWERFANI